VAAPAQEPCELLPWDSKFFGLTIARVNRDQLTGELCDEIDRWCAKQDVRCLYFLARADEGATVCFAEKFGYHLVDVRLTLERVMGPANKSPANQSGIRTATSNDVTRLKQIARASHTDTRFFFDANFDKGKAADLYETWIEASCDQFADKVFVAVRGGDVAGYVTCRLALNRQEGSIGLIAVDAAHQGQGIGRELVQAALDWFEDQKVDRTTVVTQGRNVAAQRLYARCGFITRKFELYYHRWFPTAAE
jgi:dTDP-4-amino-4,6-dideoxy-D-galactose acyltransferase